MEKILQCLILYCLVRTFCLIRRLVVAFYLCVGNEQNIFD